MKRFLASAMALSVLLVASAQAQYAIKKRGAPTGIISGIVLGPDDKPAANAAITYQSSAGNAPHAVHADAGGRFIITKLSSDNYDLRASANGIFSEWKKNFRVESGRTSDITLRLIYAREMPKSSNDAASHKKAPATKH